MIARRVRIGGAYLNRRRLVRGVVAGGLLLASGGCGSGSGDTTPGPEPTEVPPEPSPTPTQDVIASPVPGYADPERWAGRTLTIAGWGGDYQDAQEDAFFDPFQTATGATIQIKEADIGRFKSQVEDQNVTWDLLTVPTEDVLALARDDYLTPIDTNVVDVTALFPDIVMQHGIGADYYSTTIVYPAGADNVPGGWVDFWDVPPLGPDDKVEPASARALQKSPVGTLEFALIADGVATDQLYPIDVERAFASLERIRRNVVIWYETGTQPVELVAQGEVAMASAWNVRLWQLGVIETVHVQWFEGMLAADSWVVPQGAPNQDVAMDFINFATRAVPSANFARLVPFGPVNTSAFNLLRPDRLPLLPSAAANRGVQFVQNFAWWSDNKEVLSARFEDWLLAGPKEPGTAEAG